MIEHITFLSVVAFAVSFFLVLWAVYNWLTFFYHLSLNRFLVGQVQLLKTTLLEADGDRAIYHRCLSQIKLFAESGESPGFVVLKCAIEKRLSKNQCRHYFREALERNHRSLSSHVILLKRIAPPTGLLFTVLSLIFVMFKQSVGLNHEQMLGDIGVALITTGVSTFILVLQETLFLCLFGLIEREYDACCSLIDSLKLFLGVFSPGGDR